MTLVSNRERVELSTFNPTIYHGSLSIPVYCSWCVDGVFGTLVPFSQTSDGHVSGRGCWVVRSVSKGSQLKAAKIAQLNLKDLGSCLRPKARSCIVDRTQGCTTTILHHDTQRPRSASLTNNCRQTSMNQKLLPVWSMGTLLKSTRNLLEKQMASRTALLNEAADDTDRKIKASTSCHRGVVAVW